MIVILIVILCVARGSQASQSRRDPTTVSSRTLVKCSAMAARDWRLVCRASTRMWRAIPIVVILCARFARGSSSVARSVVTASNCPLRSYRCGVLCRNSFKQSKDAGYKIVAHMMPDLPNCDQERDIEGFREFFENPDFRADGLKVCVVWSVMPTARSAQFPSLSQNARSIRRWSFAEQASTNCGAPDSTKTIIPTRWST